MIPLKGQARSELSWTHILKFWTRFKKRSIIISLLALGAPLAANTAVSSAPPTPVQVSTPSVVPSVQGVVTSVAPVLTPQDSSGGLPPTTTSGQGVSAPTSVHPIFSIKSESPVESNDKKRKREDDDYDAIWIKWQSQMTVALFPKINCFVFWLFLLWLWCRVIEMNNTAECNRHKLHLWSNLAYTSYECFFSLNRVLCHFLSLIGM